MNFPAMARLTHGVAALLIAVAASAALAQDPGGQQTKQNPEQQGVPFVDLNRVADKGA